MPATVLIAIGSNRRHGRHGTPAAVVAAAAAALGRAGLAVERLSTIRSTPPLGPRQRRFANAVVAATTGLSVADLLPLLQGIEREFGRRRGQRWGPRALDLDIVAAGETATPRQWRSARAGLIVPHRGVAGRAFVLDPLVEIAGGWRHPVLHLTARQLRHRLRRPKRCAAGSP